MHRDRGTHRDTETHRDRDTQRQRDRETQRDTQRYTETERYRETHRGREPLLKSAVRATTRVFMVSMVAYPLPLLYLKYMCVYVYIPVQKVLWVRLEPKF